jgi:hypothetical protein
MVHANLALGRLRAARGAATSMPIEQERRIWLGRIAIAKGDLKEARKQIVPVSSQALVDVGATGMFTAAIGVMIDAGLLSQAEREWNSWVKLEKARVVGMTARTGSLTVVYTRAHLLSAQRNWGTAIPLLRQTLSSSSDSPASRYTAGRLLGQVLAEGGHLQEAANLLTDALSNRFLSPSPAYHPFLDAQLTLANIRRKLGDELLAQELEKELFEVLAEADPDHLIAAEIRRRRLGVQANSQ